MTLEEAIKHLEETLNNPNHEWSCAECKAEHEQLLAWLKELKELREKMVYIKKQYDLVKKNNDPFC